VLVDNHGFASIGNLSQSLGQGGFGTGFKVRTLHPASWMATRCASTLWPTLAALVRTP